HEVGWWDPRSLELDREVEGGLRSHDLLVEDGASKPAADAHARWQERRASVSASGAAPSLRVETATARSLSAPDLAGIEVEHAAVAGREPQRPGGKRFGALVHAVLAEVDLRAGPGTIARLAAAHGR